MVRKKPHHDPGHYTRHYTPGMLLKIEVIEALRHSDYYFRYKGQLTGLGQQSSSGEVMIRIRKDTTAVPLQLGQAVWTLQPLDTFRQSVNPGGFNYREYARKKGLYHQLTLNGDQYIKRGSYNFSLKVQALRLRGYLSKSLQQHEFSKNEIAVIEALLLGNKQDLSPKIITEYQNAGAVHILAISGLHTGIFLLFLHIIFSPLERLRSGKKIKWSLLVIFLWAFAFISGLSPSVVRASGMFTLLSIGNFSGRKPALSHYLFAAFFLSLLCNPLDLFDLGFQLSYAAVLAIITVVPILQTLWDPAHKAVRYIRNLLYVSVAAQIGVLPLSLYYFHHFSALFLLSGLLIIPCMGIVLGMGFLMIMLDQIQSLPGLYIQFYSLIIRSLNGLISWIGGLDVFVYKKIYFSMTFLWMVYIIIFFLIRLLQQKRARNLIALLSAGLLFFSLLLWEKFSTHKVRSLTVFDQYKESLLIRQFGDRAFIFSSDLNREPGSGPINDYQLQYSSLELIFTGKIPNFFMTAGKRIMIMDHDNLLFVLKFRPHVLVIINSPGINLDRLLREYQPEVVVADGSNFTSYRSMWRTSARKFNIKFHDTSKQGAFTLVKR